jgi:hypothetical protein
MWEGLNIQAICNCQCHQSEKKVGALSEVVGPEASALSITQPPKEVIHDDR